MIDFLRFHESHPPLFYVLMRVWFSIAGNSDSSALLLVAAIGSALVPAIYVAGMKFFNRRVALAAATVTAFSPILIEASSMVRPYPLLQLLVLLATCCLVLAIQTSAVRWWAAYSVATAATVYTHNWGWLVVAAQLAALGYFRVFRRSPQQVEMRKPLLAAVLVALAFLPWASSFAYQIQHAGYSALRVNVWHVVLVVPFVLQATVLPGTGGGASSLTILIGAAVAAGFCIIWISTRSLSGVVKDSHEARTWPNLSRFTLELFGITCFATIAFALLFSRYSNLLQPRCLSVLAAPMLLGICAVGDHILRSGTRITSRAFLAVGALLFGLYAGGLQRLLETTKSNAKEVADAIALRSRADDLIIVLPQWLASSFNHYFEAPNEQIDYPQGGRQLAVDFAGLTAPLSDSASFRSTVNRARDARQDGRRVWLVSEARYLKPVGDPFRIDTVGLVQWGVVVPVRLQQVRAVLTSLYGGPDSIGIESQKRPRDENLVAYLFSERNESQRAPED
jgi:hypothetical protein